ncbi:MAG: twin-arginine translocation signal domain-containing protein [Candidatus Eremiobacterota bacterium]
MARNNFDVNIEKVLLKAVTDRGFKEQLLYDRKSALENQDISLTTEDKIILEKIPLQMLHNMIENFLKQQSTRRKFLKDAAATVALLTTSIVISSCNENSQDVTEPAVHPSASTQPSEKKVTTGSVPDNFTEYMKLRENTPLPDNFGYPQYMPSQGCIAK